MYYKFYMLFISSLALCMSGGFMLYIIFESLYYACFIEETLSLVTAIKVGAKDVVNMTRVHYLERLTWLKTALRASSVIQRSEFRKTAFARIVKIIDDLKLDRADGSLRSQPYCVLLCGPAGSGKTGVAMKIAAALMRQKYGCFYKTDVVTINETDQFQSEYRTNHKVVIFDDLAATRIDKEMDNPFRKIIDFVNNIRKTSLNPNVEMKGNVYIEPEVVIITTNMNDNFAPLGQWCNCPGAILRRISKIVLLDMNHEDATVIYHGRAKTPTTGIKDEQELHVAPGFDKTKYVIGYAVSQNVSKIPILVQELVDNFIDHQAVQESHVDNINQVFDPIVVEDNPLVCLRNDICRTFGLVVPQLPPDMVKRLPWYQRCFRFILLKEPAAVAQSLVSDSDFAPEDIDLIPHAGLESNVPRMFNDNLDYVHYVLKGSLNMQHLISLYPFMCRVCPHEKFQIMPYGFLSEKNYVFLAPGCIFQENNSYYGFPMSAPQFSLEELKDYMEFWYSNTQLPNSSQSGSVKDTFSDSSSSIEDAALTINLGPRYDPLLLPHTLGKTPVGKELEAQQLCIMKMKRYILVAKEITFKLPTGVLSCDLIFQEKDTHIYAFVEVKHSKATKARKQAELRKQCLSVYAPLDIVGVEWNFYYFTRATGTILPV